MEGGSRQEGLPAASKMKKVISFLNLSLQEKYEELTKGI